MNGTASDLIIRNLKRKNGSHRDVTVGSLNGNYFTRGYISVRRPCLKFNGVSVALIIKIIVLFSQENYLLDHINYIPWVLRRGSLI